MDRPPDERRRRRLEARTDDPTGGARLTRRLLVWLPVAALLGFTAGAAGAVATGEWRLAVIGAGLAIAVTGGVLAAVEDGRVQRRVDRLSGRASDDPGDRPGRRNV